jgi:non-ribosomal peptide synthetase component F
MEAEAMAKMNVRSEVIFYFFFLPANPFFLSIYAACYGENNFPCISPVDIDCVLVKFWELVHVHGSKSLPSLEMDSTDKAVQEIDGTSKYILQSQYVTRVPLEIPDVTTLPELFKWQAQRRGAATLFSFRSQAEGSLITVSYAQAYQTSSQLAHALYNLHPKPRTDSPVIGIWLEKSVELQLAILATTLSGATWLPFDADSPATRVSACLRDSKASILVCDTEHYGLARKAVKDIAGIRLVTFEELSHWAQSAVRPAKELSGPKADHTAYMIYTSGSTGTPKGIDIPHSAALAFCLSERSVLETGPDDIVWQGFSPAFDMFIEEV